MTSFIPTRRDVYLVRNELFSHGLPLELILEILDYARYWVENQHEIDGLKVLMGEGFGTDDYSAAYLYCGTTAFPSEPGFNSVDGELPKIKEIEFLIVSHDQGWPYEDIKSMYDTSSWFEASILTPRRDPQSGIVLSTVYDQERAFQTGIGEEQSTVEITMRAMFPDITLVLVPRPSSETESQRLHCQEMTNVEDNHLTTEIKEGEHAWYLQGNEVARGASIFEGEMVPRYKIVWGSRSTSRWVGNEGTGSGEGFVDSIEEGDWIAVWARAKGCGWENHIYGIRTIIRYSI